MLTTGRCRPLRARNVLALTGQGLSLQNTMHHDSWFYKHFEGIDSHVDLSTSPHLDHSYYRNAEYLSEQGVIH
jgi:hypothetical protein